MFSLGDIESMPFIEALRQLFFSVGKFALFAEFFNGLVKTCTNVLHACFLKFCQIIISFCTDLPFFFLVHRTRSFLFDSCQSYSRSWRRG